MLGPVAEGSCLGPLSRVVSRDVAGPAASTASTASSSSSPTVRTASGSPSAASTPTKVEAEQGQLRPSRRAAGRRSHERVPTPLRRSAGGAEDGDVTDDAASRRGGGGRGRCGSAVPCSTGHLERHGHGRRADLRGRRSGTDLPPRGLHRSTTACCPAPAGGDRLRSIGDPRRPVRPAISRDGDGRSACSGLLDGA